MGGDEFPEVDLEGSRDGLLLLDLDQSNSPQRKLYNLLCLTHELSDWQGDR